MENYPSASDESKRAQRKAQRQRRLGRNPKCRICGHGDTTALQRDAEGIICYECAAALKGKSTVEDDHIVGKAHATDTITTPANIHRFKSDRQQDWPEDVRLNPHRDPLVWLAAVLRWLRDIGEWLAQRAGGLSDMVLDLSHLLRKEYGDSWWKTLKLQNPMEAVDD